MMFLQKTISLPLFLVCISAITPSFAESHQKAHPKLSLIQDIVVQDTSLDEHDHTTFFVSKNLERRAEKLANYLEHWYGNPFLPRTYKPTQGHFYNIELLPCDHKTPGQNDLAEDELLEFFLKIFSGDKTNEQYKQQHIIAMALTLSKVPWGRCAKKGTVQKLSQALYGLSQEYPGFKDGIGNSYPGPFENATMTQYNGYIHTSYQQRDCRNQSQVKKIREQYKKVVIDFPRSLYAAKALFQLALIDQETALCDYDSIKEQKLSKALDFSSSEVASLLTKALNGDSEMPIPRGFQNDIRFILWQNATLGVEGYGLPVDYLDNLEKNGGLADTVFLESSVRSNFSGSSGDYYYAQDIYPSKKIDERNYFAEPLQLARYSQCIHKETLDHNLSINDFETLLDLYRNRYFGIILATTNDKRLHQDNFDRMEDWVTGIVPSFEKVHKENYPPHESEPKSPPPHLKQIYNFCSSYQISNFKSCEGPPHLEFLSNARLGYFGKSYYYIPVCSFYGHARNILEKLKSEGARRAFIIYLPE